MFFLPDPADLDAVADRIAAHAAAARERAWRLGASVAGLDWHGVAATAFRGEAHLAVSGMRGAAGRLDDAAAALHRHAARVRPLVQDLKVLSIDGLRTAEDVFVNPANLFSDVGNLAADAGSLFGDVLGLFG